MELQSLFTVLVLLIHIVQSLLQSSFFGEVEADQLLYAAIRVPSHVTYHEVILWAEESTLHPIALLRYDGLPTMEIYDLKTSIPSLTATLKLLDKSPTQSTLYIGVYGGSKLHRYHYFAGSPTTVLFAVESNMNVCRNEMQRGANCTFVDKVGSNTIGQTTASLLQFGIRSQFTLTVPSNLEGVQVGTRIANFRNALCGWIQADTDSNILIIRTEAYFDHPDEELNSGRRVQYVNFTDLCDFQSSSSYDNVDLSLFIKRPLAGVWTYSIYIGWKSSQSTHIAGPNSRRLTNKSSATSEFTRLVPHDNIEKRSDLMGKGINVTSNGLIVPITITSKLLSCPLGYTVNVDLSGFSAEHFNTSFCTARMVSMFSLRTPMIAEGFFAMHGAATLLRSMDVVTKPPLATQSQNQQEEPKIAKTAITNVDQQASPFVVFAASITPPVQELAVGGGMVMQLRVQLPVDAEHVSNEQFAQLMDRLHFQVAVRLGGLPQDPSFYPSVAGGSGGDSSSDEWDVQSLNAFLLSTRDRAAVVDESTTRNQKADDDDDDDDDGVASSQFTSRKESCRSGVGCKRANLAQGRNGVQSLTHVRTYSWVITRPALPALHSSPLGADGVENLFIRISREPLDLPAAAAGADIPSQNNGTRSGNQRPFGVLHTPPVRTSSSAYWSRKTKDTVKRGADLEQGQEEAGEGERGGFASVSWPEDLLVSVSLTFEPCPRGSCVHGTCYTQSGDIAAYSCACR